MIDDNTKQRAISVLSRTGTAQAVLEGMADELVKELAAIIDADSGSLVPGAFEKARLVLVRHYDSLKASKAELESEPTEPITAREALPPAEE
jgi:hypothetical protein